MSTESGTTSKNRLEIIFSCLTDGWTEKFIFFTNWNDTVGPCAVGCIYNQTPNDIFKPNWAFILNITALKKVNNLMTIVVNIKCLMEFDASKIHQKLSQTFANTAFSLLFITSRYRGRSCVSVFFQMKCIFKWSVVFKCRIPMSVIIKIDTVTHSI